MNSPDKRHLLQQIAGITAMERGRLSAYSPNDSSEATGSYHKLQRWEGGKNHPRHVPDEEVPFDSIEVERPSAHEFWLLKLLFLHEELADWAVANLDPNWIQHAAVRQIVMARLAAEQDQTWNSLAGFLDECESAEMRNLITEAATEERPIKDQAVQLADVALKSRNLFIDRQMMAITQQVSHPETDDATRDNQSHRNAVCPCVERGLFQT